MEMLNQYMDFKHIIEKLQEIDKLKLVLLNKKQRKIFDNIPKIGIHAKMKQKTGRGSLFMDKLIKKETLASSWKKKATSYQFLFNGDPVNERLLALTDTQIKEEIKNCCKLFGFIL